MTVVYATLPLLLERLLATALCLMGNPIERAASLVIPTELGLCGAELLSTNYPTSGDTAPARGETSKSNP
jgi:hypothetical protein